MKMLFLLIPEVFVRVCARAPEASASLTHTANIPIEGMFPQN